MDVVVVGRLWPTNTLEEYLAGVLGGLAEENDVQKEDENQS
jgi:hypothetical protein